jgi:uncharacterized BrkB/YihY/UPF0761 family membrane protein
MLAMLLSRTRKTSNRIYRIKARERSLETKRNRGIGTSVGWVLEILFILLKIRF